MGTIKVRVVLFSSALIAVIGLAVVLLKGPYVSDKLMGLVLPELSGATGKQVTARRISVNIFPLFIEANDVKLLEGGNEVVSIPRIKGYIGLSGFLRKELLLRRIVIREPYIRSNDAQAKEIADNIREYLDAERKAPLKVVIRTVVLDEGVFSFGYRDMSFQGSGLGVEAVLSTWRGDIARKPHVPRITFSLREISSSIKGWPELKGDITGSVAIKEDSIEIKGLDLGVHGSKIEASGEIPTGEDVKSRGIAGELRFGLDIIVESFKKIFGLKKSGEGRISGKGTMRLVADDLPRSVLDLKLDGEFYIETLMELLEVNERVEGLVGFAGEVNGPLVRLTGSADARLKNGNLFDIDVDELRCNVAYREGKLHFTGGKASLYNGHAEAEATISVTSEEYYALGVKFSDVDSPAAFKLIGWDPGIPLGKVEGEVKSEGADFNPSGWYSYESTGRGNDVLGRVRRVKGSFELLGDTITLPDSVASTNKAVLSFQGKIDIKESELSLILQGQTSELPDVTLPYLHELTGSGEFSGTLKGKFDSPVIRGRVILHSASYEGYYLGDVTADLTYRKDLLEVMELSSLATVQAGQSATIMMKGGIRFPEGKELFDLKKPLYGLSVSMRNADLEGALKVTYGKPMEPQPRGRFDTAFTITGPGPKPLFRGTAKMVNGTIGGFALDSASLSYSYDYNSLALDDVIMKKGNSFLTWKGTVSGDGRLILSVSGGRLYPGDIPVRGAPGDAYISFRAEGKGTLDDPQIELEGSIHGGRFRETDLGGGKVHASVKDRTLSLDATLFDGRTTLIGKAFLKDDFSWTARLDVKPGRYEFLLAPLFKELPEDMLVNMKGSAEMSGDRNRFSASATIDQLNVTLYGYSFSNDSDIRFGIRDRKLFLPEIRMRSGTTSFNVSGDMEIGRVYNLVMEGTSALSPVKGLWKRIDIVRGDAGFVFSLTGKWESPRINGGVTVSNALFGIRDIPYRISAINGYLYMDEDRIVIQKLSGKAGGGDLDVTGIAHLQGFRMKRFYLDASMRNVGGNVSKEFSVNFDGNILYSGTLDSQTISGDVTINRAKYRERVEWKSLVLKAKAREKPRGELGALERAALNIKVYGSDDVLVDNNIARASLRVDLLLRGTVSRPILLGRVESKTGTVYFRNNEFRIINASADFSDTRRINPVMQIVAETNVKGYAIRLNLEGQREHFTLVLVSDPPLDEMDILSLLTVGRFGKELKGIEGGIGAGQATAFLTGRMQDVFEERLRAITGLDRFEVDSYVSKTAGTITPRVIVSKRLLGDRLFVTYSSPVGATEGNVLKLEYLLSRNVSLVGIRDEKGSIGSDVKFRFEFK